MSPLLRVWCTTVQTVMWCCTDVYARTRKPNSFSIPVWFFFLFFFFNVYTRPKDFTNPSRSSGGRVALSTYFIITTYAAIHIQRIPVSWSTNIVRGETLFFIIFSFSRVKSTRVFERAHETRGELMILHRLNRGEKIRRKSVKKLRASSSSTIVMSRKFVVSSNLYYFRVRVTKIKRTFSIVFIFVKRACAVTTNSKRRVKIFKKEKKVHRIVQAAIIKILLMANKTCPVNGACSMTRRKWTS